MENTKKGKNDFKADKTPCVVYEYKLSEDKKSVVMIEYKDACRTNDKKMYYLRRGNNEGWYSLPVSRLEVAERNLVFSLNDDLIKNATLLMDAYKRRIKELTERLAEHTEIVESLEEWKRGIKA